MRGQISILVIARVIGAVVQAVVGIAFARAVAPGEYGLVMAWAGALLFWFVLWGLGIGSYLGRARALNHDGEVASGLVLNALTSTVGAAVAIGAQFTVLAPIGIVPVLALLVVATALEKNVDAALAVPIADGLRVAPAVSILLRRLSVAGGFFVLLVAGVDPVVAYCVGTVLGPLVGQLHLAIAARSWRRVAPRAPLGAIVRATVPFAINDIAVQSRTLDVTLVGATTSPIAAGLYAGATKFTSPLEIVSSTIAGVLLPRAARMRGSEPVRMAGLLALLAGVLLIPGAIAAFFAGPIIGFVLGPDYLDAAPVLALLIFAVPPTALGTPYSAILQGIGRARRAAALAIVTALAFLGAVAAGAALGGPEGAAAGVLIASVVRAGVFFVAIATSPSSPGRHAGPRRPR